MVLKSARQRRVSDRSPSRNWTAGNWSAGNWSVEALEQRLMLAADAGAALPTLTAPPTLVADPTAPDSSLQSTNANLVFVDPSVPDLASMLSGIADNHEIILLDANEDGLSQITNVLTNRRAVNSIHIIAHGESGQVQLGNDVVTEASLLSKQEELRSWNRSLNHNADILLYGCHTGSGDNGQQFMHRLAELTGADVAASDDATGAATLGGDWILEQSIGVIESSLAINASTREQYVGVLPITISAAGVTNEEIMELQIDGVTVATFANVGGDAYGNTFVDYTHNANGISADRIRVAFTNDFFDEATETDRNLRVDSITVDGQIYQTEDPSVFSTGTWLPADGIVPGFGRGDFLHSDGYFQYASSSNNGSSITIQARGETGQESMSLLIDGVTVQSWNDVGTTFSAYNFTAAGTVSADQIRVEFTNDLYDPGAGVDNNLTVDFIQVDGQTVQTESSSVFSTGTWLPADGVTPGFGRGETLHVDGYFQYDANTGGNGSQITVLAEGFEGDENIELQIDGVTVQQWNNIGTTQQTFVYNASSTVTADQIRVAFTNDLFDAATNVDRNALIDRIEVDGTPYESEASTVYSTGTWTAADGIVPGFGRGEILHSNGYFEYDSGQPSDNGTFLLANSVINVNESAGVAVVTIVRAGSTATPATIEFRTVSGSAVDGSDFTGVDSTLSFAIGQTSRDVVIPIVVDSNPEGTESFSFTIDNPSGAGLSVPRTATITINDVQLPQFSDFADVGELNFNGSASQSGSALQLTPAASNLAGSAYYSTAIPVNSDTSFQSQFSFRISGGAGADGLAFIVQNSPAGPDALGPLGGNFAYAGITNSLAIEFDTYANLWDVNDNHISVLTNGVVDNPIATKTYGVDLNNGANKYAWIDYNGTNNVLAVYLSETNVKPGTPLIVTNVDLSALAGNQLYAGFGAGTGGLVNNHEILSWSMNTDVPPIPNDPNPGGQLASQTVASNLVAPTSIDFTPDGTIMYIAEQRGIVHVYQNGSDAGQLLDFTDRVNGTRDRGLLDIAVHPDLANNPYLYLLYTYDPPEVNGQSAGSLAGPDGNGNRAGRLTRVTLDASTGYTSIVANSEVILLGENSTWDNFNGFVNSTSNFAEPPAGILPNGTNIQDFIASDSESHTVGSVEFGPDGALYVSIGDGTSYNQVDARTVRVQDIDNLSGKILRVDPITGDGLSDNPFYNGDADANRSKVYQYGVRNPFRIAVDDATGQVYVGDVGWTAWEEINAAGPGANFGWPFYEGSSGANAQTAGYSSLPEASSFYANNNAVPSILALNHSADGINAIVLGDIYSGSRYPAEYQGDLFFNDLGQGIVRNISFDANGNVAGVSTFATGANYVVQIVQAPDGFLYYVDLDSGLVGRWEFV